MTAIAAQMPASHKRSMLDQQVDPNKFDTRTHLFDNQGRLVKKNLYTLYVVEGEHYYERPMNSGNLWYANNQPAGRVTFDDGLRRFDHAAKHLKFTPTLEGDESLHHELQSANMRNEDLQGKIDAIEQELALIRAERRPVAAAAPAQAIAKPSVLAEAVGAPKLRADKSDEGA